MLGFAALGENALGEFANVASLTISGQSVGLTISGQSVGLYATRYLTAETGVFTLTFNSAERARSRLGLSVTSGGGVRGLNASAGGGGKGLRIRA